MPYPIDELLTWFVTMPILFANKKFIEMCWSKLPGVSDEFKDNFTGMIGIILAILGFGYLVGYSYSVNISLLLKLFVYLNGVLAIYALYLVSKIQGNK